MKKTITKILAIIGAIAAVGTLIFIFRDKIAKLLQNCKCQKLGECDTNDLEGCVEDAVDAAAEKAEEITEAAADKAEDFAEAAEEKAAAIAEEFKDYADVAPEA